MKTLQFLNHRYDENFTFVKSSLSFTFTRVSDMRPEQGSDLHIPDLQRRAHQSRDVLLDGSPFGPFGPLQSYGI